MGKSASKRIGILGGTFNPVHNGHLHVAREAVKRLGLDKVIFVPAYIPPHKKISGGTKAAERLKMLRLALGGKRHFSVSEYEIRKKGSSYSIRTVKFLKRKLGKKTKLFFLIGADSLTGLGKWKDAGKLFGLLQFVVIPRPGFNAEKGGASIVRLKAPGKDVSSSNIRKLVREGRSIRRLVPMGVHQYIRRHKLYG